MHTLSRCLDVYLSTSILYREQNLSDNITEICHARSQSIYFTILDTAKIVFFEIECSINVFAPIVTYSIQPFKHVDQQSVNK